ncbi:MAG: EpsI family protein [Sterolibacteriaceae bacterium]|nr:EpsI family protein [Sterolibacteriaceae bacterium]MBK9084250.1 EpsI family protein [Sterolibacteriaceae bacterium]
MSISIFASSRVFLPTSAMLPFWLLIAAMLAAVAIANVITPTKLEVQDPPKLDSVVPKKFGNWEELPSPLIQIDLATTRDGESSINQPYDDTLMRTYRNPNGDVIMLALAYGQRQRQEVKVHRPELCYVAQGFAVRDEGSVTFPVLDPRGLPISGRRLVGTSLERKEAISYWIRIGTLYSGGALQSRIHILRQGLQGHVPDGILVRVSQILHINDDIDARFRLQEQFLGELARAMPETGRALLIR